MAKLKPIIEDFGDGYVVFCPKCLSRLGWITDDIKKCPECHTEIKFKGKVADEPDEWVQGYLMKNNCIFQVKEHKGSKCCGVGIFQVDTETVVQVTEETGNEEK